MNLPSGQLVDLLYALLPGFLAASVFHSLTPYPKRDSLDRIVTALIFTLFAQLLVQALRAACLSIGANWGAIGPWNANTELGSAAALGLLLGLGCSHAVNKGWPHSLLHRTGTTRKTSLRTPWYGAFSSLTCHVVLNLKDSRSY